jgi:DNA invertase Pin-like site-specific DNA recombinase
MVYPKKPFHPINLFMPGYFIYCRKSSEAEDRQILSNESQNRELALLGVNRHLPISRIFSESKSAKEPGRPVFNEMMQAIYRGEAAGIICWKLDRLARNPVDGGSVIWAIKQQGIKVITPSQIYGREDDNSILMYMEFGFAQKYVDDLSKNTKRGLKTKVENGWYPGVAPIGYLNFCNSKTGEKKLIKDPDLFPHVRHMWDLMLTGVYTAPQILEIVNQQWSFRTRATRKGGGKPLSRSAIYHIFGNRFYSGSFEYPGGSGNIYQGKHEPTVTKAEYDRVQSLLRRHSSPRAQLHEFPFTGLIRCGECDRMVTAEVKHQLRCSSCRLKFACQGRTNCPGCKIPIKAMVSPKFRTYVYYHCSKSGYPRCGQKSITAEDLERQIADALGRIQISDDFKEWAIKYLHELYHEQKASNDQILENHLKALNLCSQRLDALVRLKTSPENTDGSLLSDDEYRRQRVALHQEKSALDRLSVSDEHKQSALAAAQETLQFASKARERFVTGDSETKRSIVTAIRSHLLLINKKLNIEAAKPFLLLERCVSNEHPAKPVIESENLAQLQRRIAELLQSK